MSNELKPCPFCGGKARIVIAPLMGTRAFICDKCGADVMFYGAEKDTQKAVNAWNRRANDEQTDC